MIGNMSIYIYKIKPHASHIPKILVTIERAMKHKTMTDFFIPTFFQKLVHLRWRNVTWLNPISGAEAYKVGSHFT